jgi:Leucine-rich repeat (LRR) protein
LIKNNNFDIAQEANEQLIIREPSSRLFNYDEIRLKIMFDSILPDAQFLFGRIKRLQLDLTKFYSNIDEIARMIKQFENAQLNGNQIDSIEINYMKVSGQNLDEFANYRIQRVEIKEEKLNHEDLNRMKNNFNYLTELQLSSCKIGPQVENVFEFCEKTLVKLDLSYGKVDASSKTLFKGLRNLRELKFGSSQFKEVDFDAEFVSGLDNLTVLDMWGNEFRSYKKEAFDLMSNLESLDLSRIPFDKFESGAFGSLSKLTKLKLYENGIIELKKDMFSGLVNLKVLDLHENMFEKIEPGVFSTLSKLTHLNLSRTNLKKLEDGSFQGLVSLEELDLKNSSCLNDIQPGTFKDTPNLQVINLPISAYKGLVIQAKVFSGLSKLRILNMSNCRIKSIDEDAFDDSQPIDDLNLEANCLSKFVTKCAPKKLDLSNNPELSLLKFIGRDLSRIEIIDLWNNKSELLEFNSMFAQKDQINLKELNLTFEALGSDVSFSNFKSLSTLRIFAIMKKSPIRIKPDAFHSLTDLKNIKLLFEPATYFFQTFQGRQNREDDQPKSEYFNQLHSTSKFLLKINTILCILNLVIILN